MSRKANGVVSAVVYKGVPAVNVQMSPADALDIQVQLKGPLAQQVGNVPVHISLDSLDVDLTNNQSYGMVAASTGCISNPGGPSC